MIEVGNNDERQGKSVRVKKAQSKGWKHETMDEDVFTFMMEKERSNVNDTNKQAQLLIDHHSRACELLWQGKSNTAVETQSIGGIAKSLIWGVAVTELGDNIKEVEVPWNMSGYARVLKENEKNFKQCNVKN